MKADSDAPPTGPGPTGVGKARLFASGTKVARNSLQCKVLCGTMAVLW